MRKLKIYYQNNKLHMEIEENGVVKCTTTFTEDADIINGFVDMSTIDFVFTSDLGDEQNKEKNYENN